MNNKRKIFLKYTKMTTPSFKNRLKFFLIKQPNVNIKKIDSILDTGSWILDEKSNRYFHWFTDSMMRLTLVKNELKDFPIIITEDLFEIDYIRKSIELLNVDFKLINRNDLIEIKNLKIASHVSNSGNYNKKAITTVRRELKNGVVKSTPEKRLWISRRNSDYRRIKNEDKLLPILKEFNFELVTPEEMTLEDSIRLFNSASIVGGLHGGGLTNMLFMQEDTSVIEIRRDGDVNNNCYFSLASELNIKYYYLNSISETDDYFISDCELRPESLDKLLSNYFN